MVPHLPAAALSPPAVAPAAKSGRGSGRLAAGARAALSALLLALFVRGFVFELRVVVSGSMAPALLTGDRVLVDRMAFASNLPAPLARWLPGRAIELGDVLLFRSPEDARTMLIKRCVGLPGTTVGDVRLPADRYFLLGDRRNDSHDSRDFGSVARAAVAGRVVAVLASRDPAGGWRASRSLSAVR